MKPLVCLLAVIISFSACKKAVRQELLQSNPQLSTSTITADILPAPPYSWKQLATPTNLVNINGQNRIIQVNGETYCITKTASFSDQEVYKLNSSTKKWEPSNNAFIEPSNYHYWFSYQTKIYYGGGGVNYNKLIAVDVVTLATDTLADFPGIRALLSPACFVIGNKAYVTSGYQWISNKPVNHLWEYNITTNQWVNKGNSPLGARAGAIAMVVDNKAYIGLGYEEVILNGQKINLCKNDWILYDPSATYFAVKAPFPGTKRAYARGFVIDNVPYIGFGAANIQTQQYNTDDNCLYDFWKYSPATNTWTQQANYPGEHPGWWLHFENNHINAVAVGNTGYVVKDVLDEFWKFTNSPF